VVTLIIQDVEVEIAYAQELCCHQINFFLEVLRAFDLCQHTYVKLQAAPGPFSGVYGNLLSKNVKRK
jgi:hypothetical protein